MANQVAEFFVVYPEEQGSAEVAKHLRNFWDPRMRRQLQEYADRSGDDMHPLLRHAVKHLAEVH
jgi:formate dehydrogenase subunit delta